MHKKQKFSQWLCRLGSIHCLTMIAVYGLCRLTDAEYTLNIPLAGQMFLFSMALSASDLVYLSGRELSEGEWLLRSCVHFILLAIILLPLTYTIGLWQDRAGCLLMVGLMLVVYATVRMLAYLRSWCAAEQINRKLRERKQTVRDAMDCFSVQSGQKAV